MSQPYLPAPGGPAGGAGAYSPPPGYPAPPGGPGYWPPPPPGYGYGPVPAPPPPPRRRGACVLWLLGGLFFLLLLCWATVLVLSRFAHRELSWMEQLTVLPATSRVTAFYTALTAHDYETAYAALAPDLQRQHSPAQLASEWQRLEAATGPLRVETTTPVDLASVSQYNQIVQVTVEQQLLAPNDATINISLTVLQAEGGTAITGADPALVPVP